MNDRFSFQVVATLLVSFSLIVSDSGHSTAADWPQFRGPGGNASTNESAPSQWNATDQMAWKSALPGRGASSPIVVGERIFLTSYSGYGLTEDETATLDDLKLHLLCYDRTEGKLIWDQALKASPETQSITNRVIDHGYATSTPVTDGESIFTFFAATGVVAFDWNGKQLWQTSVGSASAGFGSASSPVLYEDLVIVNASIESDTVFALDKKTGQVVWKIADVNRSWQTPCLGKLADGETELIINQKDTIYGFDPKTGRQLWSCEGIHDYVVPVPIVHDGIVYCLGGRSNRAMAVTLGGRGDVTETHKLWETNVGANVTSPIYHEGKLYWSSDKGIAVCMDATSGDALYRERLPTSERIYASIVRAGDKLYVTTRDQGVVVLDAVPEYKELSRNTIDTEKDWFNAGPAISDGQIFMRTDSFLYCIGQRK